MTYANAEAGLLVLGLALIGLGIWIDVGIIANDVNAHQRREESWQKWTRGDWV